MENYKEKAKAYDKALEIAKKVHKYSSDLAEIKRMEHIFPELKESEGEKVRKWLIDWANTIHWSEQFSITKEQVVAWLEKQGEQKETLCDKCKKEQHYHSCQDITALGRCYIDGINTSNKVEPKFHEGDWVVYKNDICQIVKREEGCNKLVTTFGIEKELVNERNLSTARRWTIEDAKDGDVLVNGSNIFIFHFINGTRLMGYCHVNTDDGRFYDDIGKNECFYLIGAVVNPATKEQRDTLFAKMKEAGYEWDAEKKELKKIEPIDDYEGLTDFERTLADICIGWIGKEIGWKQYIKDNADVLLKITVEMFNSVQDAPFEHKPAWTGEVWANAERHKRDGEIYIGGIDVLPEISNLPHKSKRVTMARATGRVEELELAVLRKVAEHYGGRTIDNIIQNYEQIIKERDENNKKKYVQETHI